MYMNTCEYIHTLRQVKHVFGLKFGLTKKYGMYKFIEIHVAFQNNLLNCRKAFYNLFQNRVSFVTW